MAFDGACRPSCSRARRARGPGTHKKTTTASIAFCRRQPMDRAQYSNNKPGPPCSRTPVFAPLPAPRQASEGLPSACPPLDSTTMCTRQNVLLMDDTTHAHGVTVRKDTGAMPNAAPKSAVLTGRCGCPVACIHPRRGRNKSRDQFLLDRLRTCIMRMLPAALPKRADPWRRRPQPAQRR